MLCIGSRHPVIWGPTTRPIKCLLSIYHLLYGEFMEFGAMRVVLGSELRGLQVQFLSFGFRLFGLHVRGTRQCPSLFSLVYDTSSDNVADNSFTTAPRKVPWTRRPGVGLEHPKVSLPQHFSRVHPVCLLIVQMSQISQIILTLLSSSREAGFFSGSIDCNIPLILCSMFDGVTNHSTELIAWRPSRSKNAFSFPFEMSRVDSTSSDLVS